MLIDIYMCIISMTTPPLNCKKIDTTQPQFNMELQPKLHCFKVLCSLRFEHGFLVWKPHGNTPFQPLDHNST